jgi:hypothetical protein
VDEISDYLKTYLTLVGMCKRGEEHFSKLSLTPANCKMKTELKIGNKTAFPYQQC